MPSTKEIYRRFAKDYHMLVMREDYQGNLLPAILAITPLQGRDVVELGAGTGRLSDLISSQAQQVIALDLSFHMLSYGKNYLSKQSVDNINLVLGSHWALPLANKTADTVIAGWSFCYAAVDADEDWQSALEHALDEVKRILREDGSLILIESLGTGFETPDHPDVLADYLAYLDAHGFQSTWIRTDYCFTDRKEAQYLTTFFFGDDSLPMWENEKGMIVPECTGLWWMRF